jgi:hypothetical protein
VSLAEYRHGREKYVEKLAEAVADSIVDYMGYEVLDSWSGLGSVIVVLERGLRGVASIVGEVNFQPGYSVIDMDARLVIGNENVALVSTGFPYPTSFYAARRLSEKRGHRVRVSPQLVDDILVELSKETF